MRLIYFSPVPWDSYEQRPHYFARYFLHRGGDRVIWINPQSSRLPNLGDRHRLSGPGRGRALRLDRPPGLTVMSLRALPIDPLPGGASVNKRLFWRDALLTLARDHVRDTVIGIGRPTALALAALKAVPHVWSFYDAMDMFPEFYQGLSRRFTRQTEDAVATRVTRIFASSRALADKFLPYGPPVTLMRNAYDMDLLPPAPGGHGLHQRGFGFLGCMGRWFDWPLTVRLAQAVYPLPVTLVGPRPVPGPATLPDNVQWRPECHQADTISFLSSFSVGLIPFIRDALTRGVDPIKYYQYRGAGLTVLSTSFGDMVERTEADDTFFFDPDGDLAAPIQAALARRPDAAAVAAFRVGNTWTARFTDARILSPQ